MTMLFEMDSFYLKKKKKYGLTCEQFPACLLLLYWNTVLCNWLPIRVLQIKLHGHSNNQWKWRLGSNEIKQQTPTDLINSGYNHRTLIYRQTCTGWNSYPSRSLACSTAAQVQSGIFDGGIWTQNNYLSWNLILSDCSSYCTSPGMLWSIPWTVFLFPLSEVTL